MRTQELDFKCNGCGKPFKSTFPRRPGRPAYCSRKCTHENIGPAIAAAHLSKGIGKSETKLCGRCKEPFPRESFRMRADGDREGYCRECMKITAAARNKKWRAANPDSSREGSRRSKLKTAYGLTMESYDSMMREQSGLCAICHQPPGRRRLAVDHCHSTGRVRGLLCAPCNTALGSFRDEIPLLVAAIAYLKKYGDSGLTFPT